VTMATAPTIGVAGPFSGPRAAYGFMLKEVACAEMAADIRLVFGDDVADVSSAQAVARSFVAADVCAVVGHFNSECAAAAAPFYRDRGIPLLLPASTKPGLADAIGAYRLCPTDDDQVGAMVEWLIRRGMGHVGIWTDLSVYGQRVATLFRRLCQHLRITVGDCAPAGNRSQSAVAFFGAHHAVAGALSRIERSRAGDFVALCCDDCSVAEFAELMPDGLAVHVAVPSPNFEQATRAAFRLIRDAGLADGPEAFARRLAVHPAFSGYEAREATFAIRHAGREHAGVSAGKTS
jgi:branched-chain amino acid transport system substrate-binding protein